MKEVVIVGAGPIGLITAIILKQKGVKNVTVIDPRAGNYTRPGRLNASIFKEIERYIGHKIQFSSSQHIKDLERSLYNIAVSLGVDIQHSRFEAFHERKIKCLNQLGETSMIPCDIALDCTGAERALVHEVNREVDEKPFTFERVADNPMKHHFIAYVKMDASDIKLLKNPLHAAKQPLNHTLMMEKLRSQFNWTEFSDPYLEIVVLEKNKVCFYYETPPNFRRDDHDAWLNMLLQLKTGKPDIHFKKLDDSYESIKPRYNPLTVDPHKVVQLIYDGNDNIPMVVPMGDAQIQSDYTVGNSIFSGTARGKAFIDSLNIDDGIIASIDRDKYEASVNTFLRKHTKKLAKHYKAKSQMLVNNLDAEVITYFKALKKSKIPSEKDIIKQGLLHIADRYVEHANQLFLSGHQKKAKKRLKRASNIYFDADCYNAKHIEKLMKASQTGDEAHKEIIKMILGGSISLENEMAVHEMRANITHRFNNEDILDIITYTQPGVIPVPLLKEFINDLIVSQNSVTQIKESIISVLNYALVSAVITGNFSVLKELIAEGANISQLNDMGESLLHMAVLNGYHNAVRQLLESGANPNQPNTKRRTPLMLAIKSGDNEVVKLLLQYKADPNRENKKGETPLMQAIDDNNLAIVTLLLEFGAYPDKVNRLGDPIISTCTPECAKLIEAFKQKKASEMQATHPTQTALVNRFGTFSTSPREEKSDPVSKKDDEEVIKKLDL